MAANDTSIDPLTVLGVTVALLVSLYFVFTRRRVTDGLPPGPNLYLSSEMFIKYPLSTQS